MRLLILAGPTAVGKSELGMLLAERLGGEILAADSMQVYRLMDIGTAKPTLEDRARIPHHLLDLVYPDESFSAAAYARAFATAAADAAGRGRLPIVVGGTGLYIRAAVRQLLFPDIGARPELRERLKKEAAVAGRAELHRRLALVDPEAAARIHPNDLSRTIRALEVYEATGRPITAWQKDERRSSPYEAVFIGLTRERAELYQRIDARAEAMMAQGFPGEVESLLARGYSPDLPSMQGLGYRELCAYFDGRCGWDEAVAEIKKRTRNYAKRQLTWFRREPDLSWIGLTGKGMDAAAKEILRLLAGRWERPSNR